MPGPVDTIVYIVRHGQTEENLLGIIQGQSDTSLDETGIEQAKSVAKFLKDVPFDIAFSSDLTRAAETARIILQHQSPEIPLNRLEILRERYMGSLQGHPFKGENRPPADDTLETLEEFKKRALRFWDSELLAYSRSLRSDDGPAYLLVVTHGAFISTFARVLMKQRGVTAAPDVEITWCPNASVTRLEMERYGGGTLQSFGDASHWKRPILTTSADELKVVNRLYQKGEEFGREIEYKSN